MKGTVFYQQAELVLQILPYFYHEKHFALKGGTALNYFIRNFPRISVDIDLTYLPISDRTDSLKHISSSLLLISDHIQNQMNDLSIRFKRMKDGTILTLFVQRHFVQIKVEVNQFIRGSIYPPQEMTIASDAVEYFEMSVKANLLSFSEIYGNKLCAALDRQHPRDLFDIKLLFDNEGFTGDIRKAFIVYLISHPRPIVELLDPHLKEIADIFENEFVEMSRIPITLKELIDVRHHLIQKIHHDLTNDERRFILSVKEIQPDWSLLGIGGINQLPAVQGKLQNLKSMNQKKHSAAVDKLRKYLEI